MLARKSAGFRVLSVTGMTVLDTVSQNQSNPSSPAPTASGEAGKPMRSPLASPRP